MVALLVRSRLVTAEEDTFELAHEALARAWPRLQAWLDEDVAGQRILRHLGAAADGWDSLGRPASELYRGARLDAALEWRRQRSADLTAVERAFLDASGGGGGSHARGATRGRTGGCACCWALRVACRRWRPSPARWRSTAATTPRGRSATALHEALVDRSLALRGTPNRSVAALLAVEAYRRRPDAHAWSALLGTFTAEPTFLGPATSRATASAGTVVPGTATGGRRARRPATAAAWT